MEFNFNLSPRTFCEAGEVYSYTLWRRNFHDVSTVYEKFLKSIIHSAKAGAAVRLSSYNCNLLEFEAAENSLLIYSRANERYLPLY